MKIIFLDIDGVLNSEEWYTERMEKEMAYNYPVDEFDPKLVEKLNKITDSTGAEIVLSSTWRIGRSLHQLRELFFLVGIKGKLIDKTSSNEFRGGYGNFVRGKEIKQWIDAQREDVQYVIIDDDNDMLPEQQENFIKTTWLHGLEDYHLDLITEKLK